jgi:hypothetical protein
MKGPIDQTPILEQGLPKEYLAFLREHDPIENWEDVVPLDKPLKTKEVEYPIPWDDIQKLQHYAPSLKSTCEGVDFGNKLAPVLGLRYAYARLEHQAHLLNHLNDLVVMAGDQLSGIVEVGCFNGGLLHFIAQQYSPVQTVGFDLSPVALDVAASLSKSIGTKPKTLWLEANFALLTHDRLEGQFNEIFSNPLIIFSNVLTGIGHQLTPSPEIVDSTHAKAGVVSYWVNQGAMVLVVERHDTPEDYLKALIEKGRWEGDDCEAISLQVFEGWTTKEMGVENPLGQWYRSKIGVFLFFNKKKWDPS